MKHGLLPLVLLLLSCTSALGQEPNRLEGAWERVSYKLIAPDTTIEGDQTDAREMKIFTPTHFAYITMSADGTEFINAGGGRYDLIGNSFTERLEYHSDPRFVGTTLPFHVRWEGDLLYQSGVLPLKELGVGEQDFQLEEVWRRAK